MAWGLLKGRWRILRVGNFHILIIFWLHIDANPSIGIEAATLTMVNFIVSACAVLHNFLQVWAFSQVSQVAASVTRRHWYDFDRR